MGHPLILASTSAYRKELLARLELKFSCVPSDFDEESFNKKGLHPRELSRVLSHSKGEAVSKKHPKSVILSGDQVLDFEGQVFGKPGTTKEAFHQLSQLQGTEHSLHTSYTLIIPNEPTLERTVSARLKMRRLKEEEIQRYIAKDQPLDCCGAYKLEALGVTLFERIECADHTSIVGLPLMLLAHDLRKLDFQIP
jgi:septum formation protein